MVRFVSFVIVFFVAVGIVLIITCSARKKPELEAVTPQVANPGDIVYIFGKHFGSKINDSYVEIAGNRITASHYISWSDSNIQLQLPVNVQDGLLHVVTSNGKTKPVNFTNRQLVPIVVKNDSSYTLPYISTIEEKICSIGNLITVTGRNFGPLRNDSKVYFSILSDEDDDMKFISCDENETYYDFWSNQEIRVRIPDGVKSGKFFVTTSQGQSNEYNLEIKNMPGTKSFSQKVTYLLKVSAEVSANEFKGTNDVFLRFPIPPKTTTQRNIETPFSSIEPITANYMNTAVYQTTLTSKQKNKFYVEVLHLIPVYAISTSIDKNKIKPYSSQTNKIFADYLKADEVIPANDENVHNLGKHLYERYSNPYDTARTIYNYLTKEMQILENLRSEEIEISEIIASGIGDPYEITVLFCALCRNAKIPCVVSSGIYIDSQNKTHNHWWAEFYIEEFGWIPVDVVLGSDFSYHGKEEIENPNDFYFGSLDSHRVAFSRGWNNVKSTNIKNSTAYRKKTYAMQSIWEESSLDVKSYNAVWNDIEVSNVY
ncbi:MAG: transglutaminase domain-containing protein [Treponemataceae bacterium]